MAFNRYLIERDIPEAVDAYNACAQKARKLAAKQPGFISVKSIYADDGENVATHIW